jgi:acyl-coenzyme A synthetase/AMP-(fatty) acid ligase
VEEVMVMHEEVAEEVVVGPREEVEDELVLTVVEQEEEVEVEEEDGEEEEEGEDVLELAAAEELVDHAEPVSMIARTVASVENFIACVLFF